MGRSAYGSTKDLMQLLLITNLYPPQELGGYGRSMADFAWGLMQRGHNVQVLCADVPTWEIATTDLQEKPCLVA